MLIKAVMLFLIFMAALAMFGRLRLPRSGRQITRRCPECGRLRIGKGRCDCGQG
jgi:hypothetical protein